jgi:hypothetical protein
VSSDASSGVSRLLLASGATASTSSNRNCAALAVAAGHPVAGCSGDRREAGGDRVAVGQATRPAAVAAAAATVVVVSNGTPSGGQPPGLSHRYDQ